MKPETWVSIYAAIVGTSAFLLNLKSWLDSGVRLTMSMIADGVVIGGDPRFEEKDIVIVSVTNRGDAPTMITHLVLLELPTWWRRIRRRPTRTFIVPNPQLKGYPPNIPGELAPGKIWTGVIRKRQGSTSVSMEATETNRTFVRFRRRNKNLRTSSLPRSGGSADEYAVQTES
jgi:hypothetical protein